MQEIEAKFYVSDLDGIRARLLALEALLIQERVLETNIRFDLPDSRLRSEGRVLRLRQDTEARLTYKSGSTNEQGVLNRTEIEFVVEDFGKARQFLEALGYQKLFYYEKYRTTYALESASLLAESQKQASGFHNCHIMLDELPYGNFVEIEGEGVESIRGVADRLNLRWDRAVPASYHVLFDRLCAKHPELDPKELSFAALGGLGISVEDLSIAAGDA
jgi:adenylate cyclase, class 2